MKYILAVALLAASCNALAETYICKSNASTYYRYDSNEYKWEAKSRGVHPAINPASENFVFKSSDGGLSYNVHNFDGKLFRRCISTDTSFKDTIICVHRDGQFRLNVEKGEYISLVANQNEENFHQSHPRVGLGMCGLLGE